MTDLAKYITELRSSRTPIVTQETPAMRGTARRVDTSKGPYVSPFSNGSFGVNASNVSGPWDTVHNPAPVGIVAPLPQPTPAPSIKETIIDVKAGTNGLLSVMILDNSGSMARVKQSTLDGVTEFKQTQLDQNPNQVKFNIVTFSGSNINVIYNEVDDFELTDAQYDTRGNTNLLDAIGFCIEGLALRFKDVPEADRPALVFTILTDGEENSSIHYNYTNIKKMIKDSESLGWAFMFLGANIDAFAVGSKMGFGTANTMQYETTKMKSTFRSASAATGRMYNAMSDGIAGAALYSSAGFTDDERAKSVDKVTLGGVSNDPRKKIV